MWKKSSRRSRRSAVRTRMRTEIIRLPHIRSYSWQNRRMDTKTRGAHMTLSPVRARGRGLGEGGSSSSDSTQDRQPPSPQPSPPNDEAVWGRGGFYRLLAWTSPSYPTGAFSYSHGLEWAVEAGDVRDVA